MAFNLRMAFAKANNHATQLYKDPLIIWVVKIEDNPMAFKAAPWVNYQGEIYMGQEGACYQSNGRSRQCGQTCPIFHCPKEWRATLWGGSWAKIVYKCQGYPHSCGWSRHSIVHAQVYRVKIILLCKNSSSSYPCQGQSLVCVYESDTKNGCDANDHW